MMRLQLVAFTVLVVMLEMVTVTVLSSQSVAAVEGTLLSRRGLISNNLRSTAPANGEQIVLKSYSYNLTSGSFTTDLYVKTSSAGKSAAVQLCYSDINVKWANGACLSASLASSLANSNYELWTVTTPKTPTNFGVGSQIFAKVVQNGVTYYDNNNSKNFAVTAPIALKSAACVAGNVDGTLLVQNLGFQKTITVVLSNPGTSWDAPINVPATFVSGPDSAGFETWAFSTQQAGVIGAGTLYFIAYKVNGQTYYDNNNGANYVFGNSCGQGACSPITVDNSTLTAPPPSSCPLYSGRGIFFKTYSSGKNYLAVEALSDTIFHFDVSALRAPPKSSIWNSPMVDTDNFAKNFKGPQNGLKCSADGTTLVTKRVKVIINPTTLSVTVYDRILNTVLSTFSYSQLASGEVNSIPNPPTPQLLWTRESTQAIYGIAQSAGFDSGSAKDQRNSEGNWLGSRVSSPNSLGNVMDCSINGGCFAYTQLPAVYSIAPGYQHAFFLDVPQTLSWDMTCAVHRVTATGARALRWFTIAGDNLLDLRQQYMKIIGNPSLPPKSALGYNQAKYGYQSFDEAYAELKGLYDANIPVDVMIFDLYWFGEVLGSKENSRFGTLAWDPVKFANAANNIKRLRSLGPGVCMIEEPYLGKNTATAQFFKSLPNGIVYDVNGQPYIQDNNWWGTGYTIDHTSPAGKLWAECKRCKLISGCTPDPKLCPSNLEPTEASTEIVAHWQDLGEPEAFDPNAVYYGLVEDDGVSMNTHRSVLNVYQMLITKNTFENYKNHSLIRRPHSLTRAGAPGIQRYGGGLWSADIASDRQAMKFQYGVKKHMTMAGIDFHSSDGGGFHRNQCGGSCIHDLFTTWIANAVWFDFPVKPHVSAQDGDPSVTASAAVVGDLASNQFNVRLRYVLIPFFYSLFYRASTYGEPVLTPMFMAYQNDPGTYNIGSQYKIGPIIATFTADNPYAGDFGRGVYLPSGVTFYNLHTHESLIGTGGYSQNIPFKPFGSSSSIITHPAFVQAGSIFPMAHVDDNNKNHRCWDRKDNKVICPNKWRVYPGPTSSFTLYDDDGETTAYQTSQESYTQTATQSLSGSTATISLAPAVGKQPPQYPSQRQLIVEVVMPTGFTKVVQVTVNGAVLSPAANPIDAVTGQTGWFTTGNGRFVSVYAPAQSVFTAATVTVQFA